jgi:hypothetical protein
LKARGGLIGIQRQPSDAFQKATSGGCQRGQTGWGLNRSPCNLPNTDI